MKIVWPIAFVLMVTLMTVFVASRVFAAPPVPSVGVVKEVLSCSEIQGSPTIIRFVDQSARDASGNKITVVCYMRATADGEGNMSCVAK